MDSRTLKGAGRIAGLFSVHILTASGAALAFLALVAATNGAWAGMFFWLGIALFVDAIDGPIARRVKIAEALPRWSGDVLDLVIDFVTYVFVPAYAIAASGLMPDVVALFAGMVIVVTSALYFSDREMKLEDNYFKGFPAIWNVAAFYLLLMEPSAWVTAVSVGALAVATFLPIPFVHPIRVKHLRPLNLSLLLVGSVLSFAALWYGMNPPDWITFILGLLGLYILGNGFLRGMAYAAAEKAAATAAAE